MERLLGSSSIQNEAEVRNKKKENSVYKESTSDYQEGNSQNKVSKITSNILISLLCQSVLWLFDNARPEEQTKERRQERRGETGWEDKLW